MIEWIEQELATAQLGDKRLLQRMKLILARLSQSPLASIKAAFRGWAELMGAYRFFNNKRTSVEAVLAPHRNATLRRVQEHPRVLLLQDTTELDYSLKKELKGTGPLSDLSRQGFFAHNHVVITPERLPLGVWRTDIHARDQEQHGKAEKRKQKPIEEKESFRWLEGYRSACELAQAAPGTEVISCADREGDLYEIFSEYHQRVEGGERVAHWLIRGNQDRSLLKPSGSRNEPGAEPGRKIREQVQASPLLGTFTAQVKTKEQYKKVKGGSRQKVKRSARTAVLEVRATTVRLRPPHRKHTKLPPVSIQVVLATEKDPPAGEDPIDWVLYTSLPVEGFDAAVGIIDLYLGRWEIEVFHRVLKSGCKVEELQLKKDERTKVAIALYMVVAWRVLYVMKLGRECPELPCDVVFEEDEWQSVWTVCHGEEALKKKPSLGEFVTQVAELGGFLARKPDGLPGPAAIWQGLTRVRDFTLAWQVITKRRPPLFDREDTS